MKEKDEENFGFWTQYKQFAKNELLLYAIMVIGIVLGIIFLDKWMFVLIDIPGIIPFYQPIK